MSDDFYSIIKKYSIHEIRNIKFYKMKQTETTRIAIKNKHLFAYHKNLTLKAFFLFCFLAILNKSEIFGQQKSKYKHFRVLKINSGNGGRQVDL